MAQDSCIPVKSLLGAAAILLAVMLRQKLEICNLKFDGHSAHENFINLIFVHWCRAPSLASFAESISSIEEESEDNLWRILPEQREYYTKQFRRLQPIEGGVVKGNPQTEVTEQL